MKKIILSTLFLSIFCLTYAMEDKRAFVNNLQKNEKEPTDAQECPVCFETYNAAHEPAVLKCTHFLCYDCAQNMINQPCPFCNQLVSITGVSLQVHLTNTYNPDEDKETSCSICEENFTRGEDVDRNACSQHIFHDACMNRLIQGYFEKHNEAQCPKCKKSIVLNLFFQAIEKGDCQLVANFIELGIDINIKDNYKTALMTASKYGYLELVALLIKHGATDYDDALRWAVYYGHMEIVSLLIQHGADVNKRDTLLGGCPPLIRAAQHGHTKIARLLIQNGAYIDAQDSCGRTALMWSITCGHFETMLELICRFADIDVQDKFGETALSRAYCKPTKVAQHWANQLLHNKKRLQIDNMEIIDN